MSSNSASVKYPKREKSLTYSPERLRWWRTRRELSLRELAEKSGVSKSHISKLENGLTQVGAGVLADLARALDCDDVTDLMPALPDGIAS
jgi:transcriptional regulator with XRE-family HTH domain